MMMFHDLQLSVLPAVDRSVSIAILVDETDVLNNLAAQHAKLREMRKMQEETSFERT